MSEKNGYSPDEARFEATQMTEKMRLNGVDTYEKAHDVVDQSQEKRAARSLIDRVLGRNKISKKDILHEDMQTPAKRTHTHEIDQDGKIQNIPIEEPTEERAA